ncbi:MAG: glycosyltransferase family 39 protein [Thermoflavifilum sp.]|nr:glycosyltransferase family 39 protein [Thermoflavifilum sp.]
MQQRSFTSLGLLIALTTLLLFARLGAETVFQVAEARNAACAREMMMRHDWIVPTFNSNLRTDKPILEYFFMILAYRMFGVSEGAARFFSAVAGLILVLWTYVFASRHLGRQAAIWSTLALCCSLHFIIQSRLATPDPYLMLFHAGALYAFFEGWIQRKAWAWWLMYAMLALAVLAKGPVGLFLPALTILLFLITRRQLRWPVIRIMKPWSGLLLFLLIALPWYVAVGIRTHGEWIKAFFWYHNFHRFSSALDAHGGPFILPLLFVLVGMLPFSLWGFRAITLAWKKRRESDALWLILLSFGVILIFYSISHTKLINYTSPSYPFLALMVGYFWQEVENKHVILHKYWIEWAALGLIVLALPIGVYFWTESTPPFQNLKWLGLLFIPEIIATAWGVYYARKQAYGEIARHIGAGFTLSILLIMLIGYPALDQQTSVRKQAPYIAQASQVIGYQHINDAFVFYARTPIRIVESLDSLKAYLQKDTTVWVIRRARDFNQLDSLPQLKLVRKDRDAFSFQYSALYQSIHTP